jgi:hypothetical protein
MEPSLGQLTVPSTQVVSSHSTSESQTSISLNPSNFKAFSEFFRMIDEPFGPKKALVLPFLEPQAQGKSRCRGILSKP